jgi:metal-responsive CopG/Arc/MetJ family transcriptional regulator
MLRGNIRPTGMVTMASETIRTHIVFPRDLVDAVDDLVGQRKRSAFVTEAVAEKLERERLGRALERTVGSLDPASHPEWDTPEKISAWVREMRAFDNESTNRKLARFRSS